MAYAEPEDAWAGIQELHYRALGADEAHYGPAAAALGPAEAAAYYAASASCVLGQLATTDAIAGNNILRSLNDWVRPNMPWYPLLQKHSFGNVVSAYEWLDL